MLELKRKKNEDKKKDSILIIMEQRNLAFSTINTYLYNTNYLFIFYIIISTMKYQKII